MHCTAFYCQAPCAPPEAVKCTPGFFTFVGCTSLFLPPGAKHPGHATCANRRNHNQNREDFFSRQWPRSLFLEWAQCCSISSTHLNPALHATSNIGSNRPHLYLTSVRYTRRSLITIIIITSVSRPGAWLSSRIASTYSGPGLASIVAVNRSMLGGLITIQRIN